VFAGSSGHERDGAIAACVAKLRTTWVFNLGTDEVFVALIRPNILDRSSWVRSDRGIAGRASGSDVFDDRATL
jgi:hypothetical protein